MLTPPIFKRQPAKGGGCHDSGSKPFALRYVLALAWVKRPDLQTLRAGKRGGIAVVGSTEPKTEEIRQLRCIECGRLNDPMDSRCERCGHELSRPSRSASIRRELEDSESLPDLEPLAAPPAPEPEWKRELSERLDGYRRRKLGKVPSEAEPALHARQPKRKRKVASTPGKDSNAEAELAPVNRFDGIDPLPLPAPSREAEELAADLPTRHIKTQGRDGKRGPTAAAVSSRAIAGLMDLAVVMVALGLFVAVVFQIKESVVTGPGAWQVMAAGFGLMLLFYWVFYYGFIGRTAGMTWMALKVVNFDGAAPTPGQRRSRALGAVLSTVSAGFGFLWSVADQQHLTWHDRISRTFVADDLTE